MNSPLGAFLLAGYEQRSVFAGFARFVGADDDTDAASKLVGCDTERGCELVTAYLRHLRAEGVSPAWQRERLAALAAVVAKAYRLAVGRWVLDVDRVFTLADQAPPRALLRNGGDRRSPRFQRCDRALKRGSVLYFIARLARDRPEILASYRRGEYPSVRQAAIAAGFVRTRAARK